MKIVVFFLLCLINYLSAEIRVDRFFCSKEPSETEKSALKEIWNLQRLNGMSTINAESELDFLIKIASNPDLGIFLAHFKDKQIVGFLIPITKAAEPAIQIAFDDAFLDYKHLHTYAWCMILQVCVHKKFKNTGQVFSLLIDAFVQHFASHFDQAVVPIPVDKLDTTMAVYVRSYKFSACHPYYVRPLTKILCLYSLDLKLTQKKLSPITKEETKSEEKKPAEAPASAAQPAAAVMAGAGPAAPPAGELMARLPADVAKLSIH